MEKTELSTKDYIRETALELFKSNGYENVTIMDICHKCQIAKRTFYYHFTSKADLISTVMTYLGIKAERLLSSFVEQDKSVDILWQIFRAYAIQAVEYGPNITSQIYIQTIKDGVDYHFPQGAYLYPLVLQLIEKSKAADEITNPNDPETIALILYHTLRSISVSWSSENGGYDLETAYKHAFDAIVGRKPETE